MNAKVVIAAFVCAALAAAATVFFRGAPSGSRTDYLDGGRKIIAFGDSLTHGTGAPPQMSYPAQLSKRLNRPVVNAGVPGDTTAEALARLDDAVFEHDPGIVLVTLGGNDLKNRIPAEAAFENLERIVRRIQDTGALVVIGGISIPFWDRGFSVRYRQLAEQTGAVLIENVYEDIMGDRTLMSDPIHPNGDGYRVMAEHFAEVLRPYLVGG